MTIALRQLAETQADAAVRIQRPKDQLTVAAPPFRTVVPAFPSANTITGLGPVRQNARIAGWDNEQSTGYAGRSVWIFDDTTLKNPAPPGRRAPGRWATAGDGHRRDGHAVGPHHPAHPARRDRGDQRGLKAWINVFRPYGSTQVRYQVGGSPFGPWSKARESTATSGSGNYALFAHAEYATGNELTRYLTFFSPSTGAQRLLQWRITP